MSRSNIERQLNSFIVDSLLEDEPAEGRDPLATDSVDSLGLGQLADFIEREFDVTIEDEEMVKRNFASVPALADFVASKLNA